MTLAFNQRIRQALDDRKQSDLFRSVQTLEGGNQPVFQNNGQRFHNFSSNDYLGLASSDELKSCYQRAVSELGVGSGASPLVTGYSNQHHSLELALTEWLGYEGALFFSSGFAANQAAVFALLKKGDLLIQDRLNHASLMEAGALCDADMKRYRHCDNDHLATLLQTDKPTMAVTESVFSMDGDIADLDTFISACQQAGALSMIDDAHGLGVIGEQGNGAIGCTAQRVDILVVTFGKAFGLNGAAILCSKEMKEYLTQFARHYVYSTAFSAAHAVTITKAIEMIQTQHWRREKLSELGAVYDEVLQSAPGYISTQTPIKPWLVGGEEQVLRLCNALKQEQIWTTAIRPPTVPKGSARLRITLSATHDIEAVEQLATSLKRHSEGC
ncbi:8-amino-7-oxononanoate synthase [Vibrio maritimus]|uniref:8-amino-7-oxononanoate synthase n=1 Tax=Vibrio maritimus TaxID=990268 RepID=A0A090SLJ2_9VIBR|nr:8-amino-7-oxononanoate synthase [Vibrio maritimus]